MTKHLEAMVEIMKNEWLLILTVFSGILIPGYLYFYLYNPALFNDLETIKLLFLSIAFSCSFMIVSIFSVFSMWGTVEVKERKFISPINLGLSAGYNLIISLMAIGYYEFFDPIFPFMNKPIYFYFAMYAFFLLLSLIAYFVEERKKKRKKKRREKVVKKYREEIIEEIKREIKDELREEFKLKKRKKQKSKK